MTRWRAMVGWESVLLCLVCTADMLSTLFWLHRHQASEENPWMALWLAHGDWAFIAVKLLSFVPFLLVAAYYRPRRPRLIAVALRATLVLYLFIYLTSVGGQFLRV